MFKKRVMLIAVFSVGLLAMSAVSATDLNATDEISTDEMAIDDILEISQDETLSTTKTVTGNTFDDIQEVVDTANDDDVIELSGTYTGSESEIKVNKKLTFIGKNNAVLDANKKSGIFYVVSEGVSFKSITFINVDSEYGYETAISINAAGISITDCTFINNTGEQGAAIHVGNECENLQIENCTFKNNVADDGGAVYYDFSQLSPVVGCTFIGNSANNHNYYGGCGGAVYGNAINCTFMDNLAESVGGAVCGDAVNCTFIDNGADEYGGAVSGDAVNCTFIGNFALYGGAVSGSALNCIFINNTAGDYGGALVGNAYNSTFTTNRADNEGGAVFGAEIILNSKFTDNSAERGGAISLRDGTVDNCEFVGNFAYENGGAIYSSGNVNIRKSEFTANEAENGGAIYAVSSYHEIDANPEIVVYDGFYVIDISDNSKFTDNHAINGGAIFIAKLEGYHDRTTVGKFYLNQNVVFENNEAEYGGALYIAGTEFDLKNSTFKSNHAQTGGNAIYFDDLIVDKNATSAGDQSFSYDAGDLTFEDNEYAGAILTNGNIITVQFDSNYNGKGLVRILSKSGTSIKELESTFSNGKCQFNLNDINGVATGDYYISISYANNTKVSVKLPISVESKIAIASSNVTKYFGGAEKYNVILTENGNPLTNKDVKITVNGKISTVKTDSKGHASVDLNLSVGTYDVVSEYGGISITSKVTVKSTLSVSDASSTYLNSKVSATFFNTNGKALTNTKVNFKANGKSYFATTGADGVATANVDLSAGNYNVTATNPVSTEQKTFKLVISKAKSSVSLSSSQVNGITTLTASVNPSGAGGNVIFNVNGKEQSVAVKSGKAVLTLTNPDAGNYTATAAYNGDNNLNASTSNSVTFSVAEVYPILTAKAVTKTYGTATKLVVNLKDNKGKAIGNVYVKVVLGGVTKNIKTNAKGQATMAIGNAPGSYAAKITYGTAQATPKITVKKTTPKITAVKKTFKFKTKTKQYTITLKVNSKVMKSAKVTLKVNGKTYSAKTNSKGKATFKITKLTKKGTFNAVIKYAGNKYYNKASKTVKITTKK